jgi:hypothetical protein
MAARKLIRPQSAPLDLTEEEVRLAREGKSYEVFKTRLGQPEKKKPARPHGRARA